MTNLLELQNRIQRDLAWRKRELSDLRTNASVADETATYIFRASQVMLCAHWEGFLKTAVKYYLEHIFSQNIKLSELTPSLISVAYFDDVMRAADAKYPGSEDHHMRLAHKILNTIDNRVIAPAWGVDTEGNPGTDVLERIMKTIGLKTDLGMPPAAWGATKVFINEQLVRDRHQVAHGEGTRIAKDSFLERTERLLHLLDTLSDYLLTAAESKSYKVHH